MKMILTIKEVEDMCVARLVSMGQLFGSVDYEVRIDTYSKDFMTIQPVEKTKEEK